MPAPVEPAEIRLHVVGSVRILVKRHEDGTIMFVGPKRHRRQLKSILKKMGQPTDPEHWFHKED